MTQKSEALAAHASLKRIEAAQASLRKMLRAVNPAALNRRPATGAWSAMENVRHLLFAEQYHFGPHPQVE